MARSLARQGAAAAPTRRSCCPATARRRPSAASAPPTRTCSSSAVATRRGPDPRTVTAWPTHPAVRLPGVAARPAHRRAARARPAAARRSSCTASRSVETRAVEPLEQLLRKGEIDKEVYVLRRLHADAGRADDAELGLHFDLTVPFARYVLENAGHAGSSRSGATRSRRCWRGERPQEGRYREFTQADIDVVGDGDAARSTTTSRSPLVMAEALARAAACRRCPDAGQQPQAARGLLPRARRSPTPAAVLRAVDKLDKIGPDGVRALLRARPALTRRAGRARASRWPRSPADGRLVRRPGPRARASRDRAARRGPRRAGRGRRRRAGAARARLGRRRPADRPRARLLHRHRLRDAAGRATSTRARSAPAAATTRWPPTAARPTPASGSRSASPGCWRRCSAAGCSRAPRSVPTCVLVAVDDEESRAAADAVAGAAARPGDRRARWRRRPHKFGKQIRYADRRGIPYVWFPGPATAGRADEVKDIRSGDQVPADAATWAPAERPPPDGHPPLPRFTSRIAVPRGDLRVSPVD